MVFNRLRGSGNNQIAVGRVFQDLFANLFLAFATIAIILMLLPHEPAQKNENESRSRGNLRVEIFWPNEMNVDIDTWGKAPGMAAIGYSNMNGPVMNLVRDDLGNYADLTGVNYETMFSRGLPPGEYIFNIHWFGNAASVETVPVKVFITLRKDDSNNSKTVPQKLITTEVNLTEVGEELTILRFKLDDNGDLITNSMNNTPIQIRSFASDIE